MRVLNNLLKDNLKQDQVLNDTSAKNKQEILYSTIIQWDSNNHYMRYLNIFQDTWTI